MADNLLNARSFATMWQNATTLAHLALRRYGGEVQAGMSPLTWVIVLVIVLVLTTMAVKIPVRFTVWLLQAIKLAISKRAALAFEDDDADNEYPCTTAVLEDPAFANTLTAPDAMRRHCRRVGKYAGERIREEMGRPKYTEANRIVAIQRVEAFRKEKLSTHFRVTYIRFFTENALYYVFTPTRFEVEMSNRMHSVGVAAIQKSVQGRWDCALPTWLLPTCLQRPLGLATWVGPGFQ
jgi:hypothetical protein